MSRLGMDMDCQLPDFMRNTSMVTLFWILLMGMVQMLWYILRFAAITNIY